METIFLQIIIFLLGSVLAIFIPAGSFYIISLEKRFSYHNHLLSFLNHHQQTKKLYRAHIVVIALALITYFFLITRLTMRPTFSLSSILLFSSSIILLLSVFFTYNFKKKDFNRIMHGITVMYFIAGFGLGIVFLHIELLKINPYIAIGGLVLTFINVLFGSIYWISVKKINSILEIIIMFFFSWWLLFFSIAQFFLFYQI